MTEGRWRRRFGLAAAVVALALLFWLTAVMTSPLPRTSVVALNVHGVTFSPPDTNQRLAPLSLRVLADAQQDASTPTPRPSASPTSGPVVTATATAPAPAPTPTPRPTIGPTPTPTIGPTPSITPIPLPTPTPSPSATSGTITGQVLDSQTRAAIAGATVSASPGGYSTLTGVNGTFTLAVPVGSYTVTASAPTYNSASASLAVKGGQQTLVTFKLTSVTAYGSISGTVVDSITRTPIVGARVALSNGLLRLTDTNGNFSFSIVLEGTYTMTVNALGYVTESQSVTVKAGHNTAVQIALVR